MLQQAITHHLKNEWDLALEILKEIHQEPLGLYFYGMYLAYGYTGQSEPRLAFEAFCKMLQLLVPRQTLGKLTKTIDDAVEPLSIPEPLDTSIKHLNPAEPVDAAPQSLNIHETVDSAVKHLKTPERLDKCIKPKDISTKSGKVVPEELTEIDVDTDLVALCLVQLGYCYLQGSGIRRCRKKGARCIVLAAELGDADAQWQAGNLHLKGVGMKSSQKKAAYWFRLSGLDLVNGHWIWKSKYDGEGNSRPRPMILMEAAMIVSSKCHCFDCDGWLAWVRFFTSQRSN